MSKKSTGERLEFYDFSDVTVEHLHRYAIASDFVAGKIVLDIASGEGYGTNILSKSALEVIGVDIDLESVVNANKKYSKSNLKFVYGSADKIPVDSNSIDVVISFETLEHHDKHHEMLLEIKRVLKHDGILIMSSPDKKYYSDLTGQINPFHVKELYFKEFKALIDAHFANTNYYFQNSFNLNSFIGKSDDFTEVKVYSGDETSLQNSFVFPVYNIAIASHINYYSIEKSFYDGNEIRKRLIEIHLLRLEESLSKKWKQSSTYKIGNLIIYPFFKVKKSFKRLFN
jgi:ubiquinone/menaquinone biosynthesis C-methylase UbiE